MEPRTWASKLAVATQLVSSIALVGCAETLPVPPSRLAVHETPGTVGARNTEVGGGVSQSGSVFNGSATSGSLAITHGLREDLDVRADVAVGAVVVDSAYLRHRITPFGTARLGIERNLVEGIFSLVAGVGGGGTRAGGFVAVDAGFVVGYENRYASPFVGAVLHVGVPVTSKTLSIVHQDDATTVRTETRRAYASFGFVASAGVRVPFGGHRSGEPHRHALQLSVDFGGSYGDDPAIDLDELDGIAFVGGTLAYRSLFGARL